MPNFRWPLLYHDLSLAKDVISIRPEKTSDWDAIAAKLSTLFSTDAKPVSIKGRACHERLDLLLKKVQGGRFQNFEMVCHCVSVWAGMIIRFRP